MSDNVKARVQNPNGTYTLKEAAPDEERLNSQERIYEIAYENA